MADQFTTLTLATLPTTRSDESPLTASDIGGANVYKNGALYAFVNAPLAVGETYKDLVAAASGDKYVVTVVDTQTPPAESEQSNVYVVSIVAVPLAAPSALTISGVTA